jgi:hypothetical protein
MVRKNEKLTILPASLSDAPRHTSENIRTAELKDTGARARLRFHCSQQAMTLFLKPWYIWHGLFLDQRFFLRIRAYAKIGEAKMFVGVMEQEARHRD